MAIIPAICIRYTLDICQHCKASDVLCPRALHVNKFVSKPVTICLPSFRRHAVDLLGISMCVE